MGNPPLFAHDVKEVCKRLSAVTTRSAGKNVTKSDGRTEKPVSFVLWDQKAERGKEKTREEK